MPYPLIKNAESVGKPECIIHPASKVIGRALKVMADRGYIGEFEFIDERKVGNVQSESSWEGSTAVVLSSRGSLPRLQRWRNGRSDPPRQELGVLILSTNKGVMAHSDARAQSLGGQLLAYVY